MWRWCQGIDGRGAHLIDIWRVCRPRLQWRIKTHLKGQEVHVFDNKLVSMPGLHRMVPVMKTNGALEMKLVGRTYT